MKRILFYGCCLALVLGCDKFLDQKPDKKLVVPATLADAQALLDNFTNMNNKDIAAGEISADNYYLTTTDWSAISQDHFRNMYAWKADSLFPSSANDWTNTYAVIYTANAVLECLDRVERTPANSGVWDDVRGQALFHRGRSFLSAAAIWSPAVDVAAHSALGLPLRLNTDFNQPSVRVSVDETYRQVLIDLQESAELLPTRPVHVMRASRPAAYALLARTCLSMRLYEKGGTYADSCLKLSNALLNFNTLSATAAAPVPAFNAEVLFHSQAGTPVPLNPVRAKVDSALYASYSPNDLRKAIFYKSNGNGTFGFKGSYTGSVILFSGITTSEIYLTRAEANARAGDVAGALQDLNTLLATRWKAGTFQPFTAASPAEALAKVLAERRKELVFRGLRWIDIKRINKEGAGIALKRLLNGVTYTLPPGDGRYNLPLPEEVVRLSGMPQNPR